MFAKFIIALCFIAAAFAVDTKTDSISVVKSLVNKFSGLAKNVKTADHIVSAQSNDGNAEPSGWLEIQAYRDWYCDYDSQAFALTLPLGVCVVNDGWKWDSFLQVPGKYAIYKHWGAFDEDGFFSIHGTGYSDPHCNHAVAGSTRTGSIGYQCTAGTSVQWYTYEDGRPQHGWGYSVKVFPGDECGGNHGAGLWVADETCVAIYNDEFEYYDSEYYSCSRNQFEHHCGVGDCINQPFSSSSLPFLGYCEAMDGRATSAQCVGANSASYKNLNTKFGTLRKQLSFGKDKEHKLARTVPTVVAKK